MHYKHLFFDLDHTLWDHHANANSTLTELFQQYGLGDLSTSDAAEFTIVFHRTNHLLWHDYHLGKIDQTYIRKERFKLVLAELGIFNFEKCQQLADEYLYRCPRKSNLMPNAIETLEYLKPKYPMTIITNGFEEIQEIKLSSSGLDAYFDLVVTSELAGSLKPDPGIFNYSLRAVGVDSTDCVMIGDNPDTDIAGAREAGIDQVYYDPQGLNEVMNPTYKIRNLGQLQELL